MENINKKNNPFSLFALLTISVFIVIAIIYTVINRTTEDFLKYSLYITLIIATIILLIFIPFIVKIQKSRNKYLTPLIILITITILSGISYYSIAVSIKDMDSWIQSPSIKSEWTLLISIILILFVGSLLFLIRLNFKVIYGITEVVIGVFIGIEKESILIFEKSNSSFFLALLTASVYLVVRGFDNIHQGLTKEPKDKSIIWLSKFIKKSK